MVSILACFAAAGGFNCLRAPPQGGGAVRGPLGPVLRSGPSCLTYLPTYLPGYLPTYLATYLPTWLPTHLLPIDLLPTYLLPTYPPSTYLPTCESDKKAATD